MRSDEHPAPKIQLLVFHGCPLAAAARRSLQVALTRLGLDQYDEVDLLDEATPHALRAWGSPTILIDGQDVADGSQGENIGCRVYDGPDRVPTAETIAAKIRALR